MRMAVMIDQTPKNGGEKKVWNFLRDHTPDSWIVYNNRKINNYEFDACILIPNFGLVIIEVKGWRSEDILSLTHDSILIENFYVPQQNPDKQATKYRYNLLNLFRERFKKNPKVMSMVWFTNISEEEYWEKRLDVPCPIDTTLLNIDFNRPQKTINKILDTFNTVSIHDPMNQEFVNSIRSYFEPGYEPVYSVTKSGTDFQKIEDSPDYSKILFLLNPISEAETLNIVNAYFSGTKLTIFTSEIEMLLPLLDTIDKQSALYGIAIKSFSVDLATDESKTIIPDNIQNEFRLFNLEIYQSDQLSKHLVHNDEIINGNFSPEFELLLGDLNRTTNFNFGQYLIEHSPVEDNTLVMAGAGTGKTYTMVSRVAFICLNPEVEEVNLSRDIAILTFTNKAAENMKTRIKNLFLNYFRLTNKNQFLELIDQMQTAEISTIARFCLNIIQNSSIYTGMGTDFQIRSDEYIRQNLYLKYLNEYLEQKSEEDPEFVERIPRPLFALQKSLIQLANKILSKSINLSAITPVSIGTEMNPTLPFYSEMILKILVSAEIEFEKISSENNCLDLSRVLSILMNNPNIETISKSLPFRYLIIDEFQDTDDRQIEFFQLIQQLAVNHPRFFIVGDLKQSIYRFRGATVSAFDLMVKADLYPWKKFSLTKNYRTDKTLLELFDAEFQSFGQKGFLKYSVNEDRLSSSIKFDDGISDELRMTSVDVSSQNQDIFYDQIVDEIKQQKEIIERYLNGYPSTNDKTIALLVRTNSEADQLIKECKKRGLNVIKNTGENLFDQVSTLDLQILLNAILNYEDSAYLAAFIESNYINASVNYLNLKNLNKSEKLKQLTKILEEEFIKKCNMSWIEFAKTAPEKPALYVVRTMFNYLKPYNSLHSSQVENYIQNFQFLVDHLISLQSSSLLTLSQIQNYLEVQILTGQKIETGISKTCEELVPVICSTIHKAKGLEFGTVILPYTDRNMDHSESMNNAIDFKNGYLAYAVNIDGSGNKCIAFNNYFDMDTESIESISEETRILYVGLTRAIHRLIWFNREPAKYSLSWQGLLETL